MAGIPPSSHVPSHMLSSSGAAGTAPVMMPVDSAPPPTMPSNPMARFANYPFKDIAYPHPHDVLCGRGGATNKHSM